MRAMFPRATLGLMVAGLIGLASAPAADAAVFYGGYARGHVAAPLPAGGLVYGHAAGFHGAAYRPYPAGGGVVHGGVTAVRPTPYRPFVGPEVLHASGTAFRRW